jgi:hypothetical protein
MMNKKELIKKINSDLECYGWVTIISFIVSGVSWIIYMVHLLISIPSLKFLIFCLIIMTNFNLCFGLYLLTCRLEQAVNLIKSGGVRK